MKFNEKCVAAIPLIHKLPRGRISKKLTDLLLEVCPESSFVPSYNGLMVQWVHTNGAENAIRRLWVAGAYEPEDLKFWRTLSLSESIVIDVGAHEGLVSAYLAKIVGPLGSVVAFEPNPENWTMIEAHLCANHTTNVEVKKNALGARRGEFEFYYDHQKGSAGSMVPYEHANRENVVHVDVETLDRVMVTRSKPISFIKVDVEGSELEVMMGAEDILRCDRPIVCFEVNTTLWAMQKRSVLELFDFFRVQGYALWQLREGSLRPYRFLNERVENLYALPRPISI